MEVDYKYFKNKANKEDEYSIRGSQIIFYYGVGALVNFPDQTLMVSSTEFWNNPRNIEDRRLKKSLKVTGLKAPTEISYVRFPEWYYCPKCNSLKPLKEWIKERKKLKGNRYDDDEDMVLDLKCENCDQQLIPSRFLSVCKNGHIHDFPWEEWVHTQSNRSICKNPKLKFKRNRLSESEGFESLIVECECGAKANMQGVQNSKSLEELDNKLQRLSPGYSFKCKGTHPQKLEKEECEEFPRVMIRGSSSIYYPITYTSLVIPFQQESLTDKILSSNCFKTVIAGNIKSPGKVSLEEIYNLLEPIWISSLSEELNERPEEIKKVLKTIVLSDSSEEYPDASTVQYKFDEYDVLTGSRNTDESEEFFERQEISVNEYNIDLIKSISLIRKVRVIKALVGFSRINSINKIGDPGFVSTRNTDENWYPAYEVKGEGIFIEFNEEKIQEWIDNNPEINDRVNSLRKNQLKTNKNSRVNPTAKYLLIHTLSHLLMKQLSYECGYNLASLSERLYVSDKEIDGKQMSGIFIYTSSGDSEGTLGGLVRQGEPDTFPKIFEDAIESAQFCSNDPICSLSEGQGNDSLNLAACHACSYIPETSCEINNTFLDRAMIVGTLDNKEIGIVNYLSL